MNNSSNLVLSADTYFSDIVKEALEKRSLSTFPLVSSYLVNLLKFYLNTDNLFRFSKEKGKRERSTLAELYLKAEQSDRSLKVELFKELADTSLYISGFFTDSLNRKLVDVSYYKNMGELAYDRLASQSADDLGVKVYQEFSKRFTCYMDVLSYISQKTATNNNKDILKLYDIYMTTGSELAKEKLLEQGVLNIPDGSKTGRQ